MCLCSVFTVVGDVLCPGVCLLCSVFTVVCDVLCLCSVFTVVCDVLCLGVLTPCVCVVCSLWLPDALCLSGVCSLCETRLDYS